MIQDSTILVHTVQYASSLKTFENYSSIFICLPWISSRLICYQKDGPMWAQHQRWHEAPIETCSPTKNHVQKWKKRKSSSRQTLLASVKDTGFSALDSFLWISVLSDVFIYQWGQGYEYILFIEIDRIQALFWKPFPPVYVGSCVQMHAI